MKVEPSARELLEVARAALLDDLVPSLPESKRYAALMVANALAIAGRDLDSPASAAAEIARIAGLVPDWNPPACEETALREGTARLAALVREGRFDEGEARARILEHLRETVRARLAVSSPRTLAREQGNAP